MKKNFLKIAALLIAAMLLVVSCSQEVKAPENDGLVKASLSVGFDRDITITDFDGNIITYFYSVTPNWDKLTSGVEPYGKKTNEKIEGAKSISQTVTNWDIGYLTPGLWTVSVEGYEGYTSESSKGTLVLQGTTNVYFNGTNGKATVLVAPVENGTAKVNISLEMQDLGVNNEIKLQFFDIKGNNKKEVTLKNEEGSGVTVTPVAGQNGNAAYKYVMNDVVLPSVGFYTVKVTVPGYENNGGYVRTFLAINGKTISISGSVYPSEFINSSLDIISISLNGAELEIGTNKNANDKYNTGSISFTLTDNNTYLTTEQITELEKDPSVASVDTSITYEWYLNSVKNGDSVTITTLSDSKTQNKTISITNPGVYSVSCLIKYQVTFKKSNGEALKTKTYIGNAYTTEFIVE